MTAIQRAEVFRAFRMPCWGFFRRRLAVTTERGTDVFMLRRVSSDEMAERIISLVHRPPRDPISP